MRQTPLFDACVRHNAKMVDFHGWLLPVQFRGIVEEHLATREKAGLFDCSHMGEFFIRGADAIRALDALVIGDMCGLAPGKCRYSAILSENGGIIDDCVALRLGPEEIYLVTNAGPVKKVGALLAERLPAVEDVSDATAKIDIQGPLSRHILLGLGLDAAAPLGFWTGVRCGWRGMEIIVSRAGYTGELGYELYLPAEAADAVWEALLEDGLAVPCGLGARDTLRTEMCYPLNGEDVDETRTPLEARMDRFIAWDTEFPGKERILAMRERGGYDLLTPVRSADRRAPRHGFEVFSGGTPVGVITSGTFGPSVGCGIGLAYLRPEHAGLGTVLAAGPRNLEITTAEVPIHKGGTCRVRF